MLLWDDFCIKLDKSGFDSGQPVLELTVVAFGLGSSLGLLLEFF